MAVATIYKENTTIDHHYNKNSMEIMGLGALQNFSNIGLQYVPAETWF
jgi:hypothetical protein